MTRLILLFTIAILFSFCKSESNNANGTDNSDSTTATASTNSAPAPAPKKHYEASHEAPFCKLWVVKISTDPENQEAYKGRWFDLKSDGTFLTGLYADQTNDGYWSIEEETDIIKLQFNTPSTIPSNWKIQGGGGGERILWKGNVTGNPKGHQVVLESDAVRPSPR